MKKKFWKEVLLANICILNREHFIQGKNTSNNYNKNKDQLTEMAAEQFAALLWKTWLFKKSLNYKKTKPTQSSFN